MSENLNDLRTFLLVAETGSFTKAAAQLGVSQSALSHAVRGLETRLGVKLLNRTTRNVSTTAAGEQLQQRLRPLFDDIDEQLNALGTFRNSLSGTLRINSTEHALSTVLWQKFQQFMHRYPDIQLELTCETRFTNIVAERFDAGIRLGDDVEKDMIAVRVSDDLRMCVAASPAYLARHGTPKTPFELTEHQCGAMRLMTLGNLLVWEFADPLNKGKVVKVQPQGQFIANQTNLLVQFDLADLGLIWIPTDSIQAQLADGRLLTVLDDWAMVYQGYHLYYPSRRADSPIFQALVKSLKV
ncbi:LysR family transcriptional regulator [Neisseria yangbaofengii]|uniref:LysR family transcriptional regulator n=1 Tax=Neisseria yangbaofengii TaxID=2709396 RepID=UPI0013ED8B64|nr:LysR family transcriptional regulator [Neisseria yangbaofengii]